MSVYVDNAMIKYGRMNMCHMIADTLNELREMADKIGIKRKWFQNNADHHHYDISSGKRRLAIQNGAVSVTGRELVELLRNKRKQI